MARNVPRIPATLLCWLLVAGVGLCLAGCGRRGVDSPLRLLTADQMPEEVATAEGGETARVLYIQHTGWGNDVFELHIFNHRAMKSKVAGNGEMDNDKRIIDTAWHWSRQGDELFFEVVPDDTLSVSLKGRAWAEGDTVWIQADAVDSSDYQWMTEPVGMSLSTRLTADFGLPTGDRIGLFPFGSRSSIPLSSINEIGKEPNQKSGQSFSFLTDRPGYPRFEPKIAITNSTGTRRVTIESFPGVSIGGSLTSGRFNANLDWTAKPGQYARFQTCLRFEEIRP